MEISYNLVIDVRTAKDGVDSGVARFVTGISRALAAEINSRRANLAIGPQPTITFVSKYEAPKWVMELGFKYPEFIRFWSGGPGALSKRWDKPIYFWSTAVFKKFNKLTQGNLFWLAPSNYDRPIFSATSMNEKNLPKVLQFIHDGIPFLYKNGMGLMFRWQFRMLVRKTLAKFPNVFTVSQHSANFLQELSKKRTTPVSVIPNGVDEIFGCKPKIQNSEEKQKQRISLLTTLCGDALAESNELFEKLYTKKWVLGIGRSQKYKNWSLAESAIKVCNQQNKDNILYIRVGADNSEFVKNSQAQVRKAGKLSFYTSDNVLVISKITDEELSSLYYLADLLVHPSQGEGFGLPPVEAIFCGLPVIFRAGTAVDEHFGSDVFPKNFWKRIDSDEIAPWAIAINDTLNDNKELKEFNTEMKLTKSTRDFILRFSPEQKFEWQYSAKLLLNILEERRNVLQ